MTFFATPIRGPFGFKPNNRYARMKNLTGQAIVAGQLCAMDIAGVEAEVANSGEGGLAYSDPASATDRGSRYGAVTGPTASPGPTASWNQDHGIFVIALEAAADNGYFDALISGEVDALIVDSDDSVAEGDPLVAGLNTMNLIAVGASGQKILAKSIETVATPTTPTMCRVLFDGVYGLGTW